MKSARLTVNINESLKEIYIPNPSKDDIKIRQYELNRDRLIIWFEYSNDDCWLDVDLFRIYIGEDKCYAVYNIDNNLVLSNYLNDEEDVDSDKELPNHEWRL